MVCGRIEAQGERAALSAARGGKGKRAALSTALGEGEAEVERAALSAALEAKVSVQH